MAEIEQRFSLLGTRPQRAPQSERLRERGKGLPALPQAHGEVTDIVQGSGFFRPIVGLAKKGERLTVESERYVTPFATLQVAEIAQDDPDPRRVTQDVEPRQS